MAKNIVVCFDVTGNEFSENKSNVVKLYKMFVHDDSPIAYYHQSRKNGPGMHSPVSVSGGPK